MLSPLRSAAVSLSRSGVGYARPLLQTISHHRVALGYKSFSCLAPRQVPVCKGNLVKWQQVRFASSNAAQGDKPERKLSSLKSILRRFYLLTHPDKFAEFPEARLANEAALRDFMAYMENYKKHPRGTPGGRMRKVPLTFYVRDERDGQVVKEPRKVTGELLVNASNPHAAKRRITQLFAACGLDGDFTFDHDVWMPPDTEHLGEFLASAVYHARESLKKASVHTTHVHTILSNIERKYGVRIGMSTGEEAYWSPSENREVADKLARLFENLEKDGWMSKGLMKEVEVGMDSENEQCAQDTGGRVYLSRKEGVEEWEEFLRTVDWGDVHIRRAKDLKTKNDEARAKVASEDARGAKQEQLAKILGVRKVDVKLYNSFESQFSGDKKQPNKPLNDDWNEEEVEDFEKEAHKTLDRLVSAKQLTQNKNSKLMKKLRNISLTLSPNMPSDRNYFIDRTGELVVSTRMQPKELLDLLGEKLPLIQELQREEQKYAAIRDFVEVRLGLKMLSMDYNYYHSNEDSVQRCNEAAEKLQRAAEKLRSLQLGGMTMAISDHYGLNLDGSLFIKWNFTDEEVVLLLEGMQKQETGKEEANKEETNKEENTEQETEQGKQAQSSSA